MKIRKNPLFVVLTLFAAGLACNLPVGGNQATATRVPEDAIETVQEAFQEFDETGELTLTLTEAQLTQFINDQLELQPEPILTDPEVELRPGQMFLKGDYAVPGGISAQAELVMEVVVDENGTPEVAVVSGTVGFLPIPEEILQTFNFIVNEILTGQISSMASDFVLTGIEIHEGEMTITGKAE